MAELSQGGILREAGCLPPGPSQGLKDRNPLGAQTGYVSKNMMESFFYKNHMRKGTLRGRRRVIPGLIGVLAVIPLAWHSSGRSTLYFLAI